MCVKREHYAYTYTLSYWQVDMLRFFFFVSTFCSCTIYTFKNRLLLSFFFLSPPPSKIHIRLLKEHCGRCHVTAREGTSMSWRVVRRWMRTETGAAVPTRSGAEAEWGNLQATFEMSGWRHGREDRYKARQPSITWPNLENNFLDIPLETHVGYFGHTSETI